MVFQRLKQVDRAMMMKKCQKRPQRESLERGDLSSRGIDPGKQNKNKQEGGHGQVKA